MSFFIRRELKETILHIIESYIANTHLFLVDLQINKNKIEVYMDGDAGFSFQESMALNRVIHTETALKNISLDDYIVEVGSPGLERPLLTFKDYQKNIGRKLKIKNHQGKTFSGVLSYIDDREDIILKIGGGYTIKYEKFNIEKIKESSLSF